MAQLHELVAPFSDGPSWEEIRQGAVKATEAVGAEIAAAKTADAAAVATLRRDTYSSGSQSMNTALLDVGKRWLERGPIFDPHYGIPIGFIGFGRRSVGGAIERIPPEHWEAGTVDWDACHLVVLGGPTWVGVRILDLVDVPPAEQMALLAEEDGTAVTSKSGAPGRPTSMYLIEQEFERRVDKGSFIKSSLQQESEFLERWLKQSHPDMPPAKAKTIRNNLGPKYRAATARN